VVVLLTYTDTTYAGRQKTTVMRVDLIDKDYNVPSFHKKSWLDRWLLVRLRPHFNVKNREKAKRDMIITLH